MDKDGPLDHWTSGPLENPLHPQVFILRLYFISQLEHTGCSVASFSKEEKKTNVIAQDSLSCVLVVVLLLNTNDSCWCEIFIANEQLE